MKLLKSPINTFFYCTSLNGSDFPVAGQLKYPLFVEQFTALVTSSIYNNQSEQFTNIHVVILFPPNETFLSNTVHSCFTELHKHGLWAPARSLVLPIVPQIKIYTNIHMM